MGRKDTVGGGKQWIVGKHRFMGDHIQPCPGNLPGR
jgi:hypothetical protein